MIQQDQFARTFNVDPKKHIANFIKMCDTFRIHNISAEAIWLRLFSFSLRERVKNWLLSLPPDSIATWEKLFRVFFAKFFPFEKTARPQNEIYTFS